MLGKGKQRNLANRFSPRCGGTRGTVEPFQSHAAELEERFNPFHKHAAELEERFNRFTITRWNLRKQEPLNTELRQEAAREELLNRFAASCGGIWGAVNTVMR